MPPSAGTTAPLEEAAPDRPGYAPEQEVRFAVVMYGGVSLAIYIHGVVQELFHMVRATAPEAGDSPERVHFATEALTPTERVYREAAREIPTAGPGPAPADVRTRFVVDILSGSSAGGINAIFLGKAIANQQNIDSLRNLWIEDGDIGALLNDRRSGKGLAKVKPRERSRSLLDSDRLYRLALAALTDMAGTEEPPDGGNSPAYSDELDLAVTTTDLQGLALPIQLSDMVVYESRHKNVLRFGYAGPRATGESRNDFLAANDEALAFAARCTSAFPVAFEPAVVDDLPSVSGIGPPSDWGQFFPAYVARDAKFRKYAFADGGYLDNKPFSYATEALRRRRADLPVRRKLLYIEPDPAGEPRTPNAPPEAAADPEPPPDAAENVIAAISLPRQETIREDIEAVIERNRAVDRIRRLTLGVEDSILDPEKDPLDEVHLLAPEASDAEVEEVLRCPQLMYRPYLRLRLETVVTDMAAAIVRLGGGRDDSDEVQAVQILVYTALRPSTEGAERGLQERSFLADQDVRFRLRRLAFAQDRINELLRPLSPDEHRAARGLQEAKRSLNDVFMEVRRRARMARRASSSPVERDEVGEGLELLRTEARSARPSEERVVEILRDPEAAAADKGFATALDTILELTRAHLRPVFMRADEEAPGMLAELEPPGSRLRDYYVRFESFDMVMFPLTYPGLEEVNPVDVVRIAPEDATNLISEGAASEERRKLAGTALGHFGAFMDADWRRNDLMWGRLDGAERILDATLPEGPNRETLVNDAHAAIIREELVERDAGRLTDVLAQVVLGDAAGAEAMQAALGANPPTEARIAMLSALSTRPDPDLLAGFREAYEVPRDLDPQRSLSVAGRAATIGGKVLDGVAKGRSLPAKPGFWLSRMGRLAWGLAEVAVPRGKRPGFAALAFRYWAQIAILLSVILILAGTLGVEAAQRVGWILLVVTLLVEVVVWVVAGMMTRERPTASSQDPGWLASNWPLLILGAGMALVLIGLAWEPLQRVGWGAIGLGTLGLLGNWALVPSERRKLRVAAALTVVAAVGLAALELGRHGGEDVSTLAKKLPGNRATGLEHAVRDGWDWFEDEAWARLWPWDSGQQKPNSHHSDLVGARDLKELKLEIDVLVRSRDPRLSQLGQILGDVLAGAPGAVASLATLLQTAEGITPAIAATILGALARGGVRATLAPTVKIDHPEFSLGGLKLNIPKGAVQFRLGGLHVKIPKGAVQFPLGGVHINIGTPVEPQHPKPVRQQVEALLADQTFRFGTASLTELAKERLRLLQWRLGGKVRSISSISINGYADYVGGPDSNYRLSRDRAEAVQGFLRAGLAVPDRIVRVTPFGEARKRATTWNDPLRRFDRRVDIVIRLRRR